MKIIRTVLGDIPADQIGATDAHDHLIRSGGPEIKLDPAFLMDDVETAKKEFGRFLDAGGRTMVCMDPIGCGRNVSYTSVFGSDPFEPVTEANVEKLIHQQCETNVQTISAGHTPDACQEKTIAVYDCASDEELKGIADSLKKTDSLGLIAGCAGLAEILPDVLGWPKSETTQPRLPEKFLVVCGSVNPITVRQLNYAEKHGFIRIQLTPEQKLNMEYFSEEDGKKWLDWFWDICSKNSKVIIDTNDPEGDNETERFAIANGIPKSEIPVRIPASLGCIIGNMVKRGLNSSMLMTGGDTLLGCIRNLGNAQLTPVGEFEIGIVLSKLISDNNKTHVFTKSGGFGEETLLTDMADKICRRA